jgi:hypothetical protein
MSLSLLRAPWLMLVALEAFRSNWRMNLTVATRPQVIRDVGLE